MRYGWGWSPCSSLVRRLLFLGAFYSLVCERPLLGTPSAAPEDIRPSPASKPNEANPQAPRTADYQRVKAKARAWLDQLDVDTVQLMKVGIKGKKKLAEILDAYLSFLHHAGDSAERQKILARVEGLVQQTRRPDYHDMLSCSDTEFVQNSMSYLRVLWLMEQLGLDAKHYREQVLLMKPRLDAHLEKRGPWQPVSAVGFC